MIAVQTSHNATAHDQPGCDRCPVCTAGARTAVSACSPCPTAQLKKISAVATASLLLRSCPARATGTTIAAMIAA
ncbi:hypothetical protein [Dactylosporangium sp. NPDC005555]|uniref:hypothetical protein n=1 Tax=Dactylosporangium sp. NPDC005555 TaxID=3154889 RepID=UPI0033BC2A81